MEEAARDKGLDATNENIPFELYLLKLKVFLNLSIKFFVRTEEVGRGLCFHNPLLTVELEIVTKSPLLSLHRFQVPWGEGAQGKP